MASTTITMYRGDTKLIQVHPTYTDVNGAESDLDIVSSTSLLTLKVGGGSAVILQLTGAVVSTNLQFSLAPADTSALAPMTYNYDVEITTAGGSVYTLVKGLFKLLEDITT